MSTVPSKAVDTVKSAWGDTPPTWVLRLAEICDQDSQSAAARKVGRSASLINQVLKNRYMGDLKAVEARVTAAFNPACHHCPILGQITGDECLKKQGLPYNPSNHLAVRLFVACRKCPHNISKKGGNHAE